MTLQEVLNEYSEALDEIDGLLERMGPHVPQAKELLEELQAFREKLESPDIPDFDGLELRETERALQLLLTVEGVPNLYAQRALEKLLKQIES